MLAMYKKLTAFFVLTLLLTALLSCQKDPILTPTATAESLDLGAPKIGGKDWTLVRDENGPRCPMPSTNCTAITLLVPNDDKGVGAVLNAIDSGIQDDIVAAFRANEEQLGNLMYSWDIDDVIAKELIASYEKSKDGEVHFIILSKVNTTEVVTAYRFDYDE
jgi:hypothetical protein